jgi:hypothetical protein
VRYPTIAPSYLRFEVCAFWVGEDDRLRVWLEPDPFPAEDLAGTGSGWIATELDATLCGTTLAAIREALTREESGE